MAINPPKYNQQPQFVGPVIINYLHNAPEVAKWATPSITRPNQIETVDPIDRRAVAPYSIAYMRLLRLRYIVNYYKD